MTHEKIFIKENGDKVKVRVDLWIDSFVGGGKHGYNIGVSMCKKGKRKFNTIIDQFSYSLRGLKKPKAEAKINEVTLQHVTPDQLREAKTELWMKLKPE